jgi:hypothetical protein
MATTDERKHRRSAKTIRNLTNMLVHLRLQSPDADKPYRIELQPRGKPGDWHTVPARLTDTGTFLAGLDRRYEAIPLSEAKEIEYGPRMASHGPRAEVIRADQGVVHRGQDWDGTGRQPQQAAVTQSRPATADVPGSDAALHAALEGGGQSALPPGALDQRVTTERVKGD